LEHRVYHLLLLHFYNNPSTEHIFQVQNVAGDNGFAESFQICAQQLWSAEVTHLSQLNCCFAAQPGDLRYTTLTRAG
jgi:hypothetical protein